MHRLIGATLRLDLVVLIELGFMPFTSIILSSSGSEWDNQKQQGVKLARA